MASAAMSSSSPPSSSFQMTSWKRWKSGSDSNNTSSNAAAASEIVTGLLPGATDQQRQEEHGSLKRAEVLERLSDENSQQDPASSLLTMCDVTHSSTVSNSLSSASTTLANRTGCNSDPRKQFAKRQRNSNRIKTRKKSFGSSGNTKEIPNLSNRP